MTGIINMKKEDVPYILYFYLQDIIGEPSFNMRDEGLMSITEAEVRMFQWKIPKELKPAIIRIWQNLGIVEKVDRRNIRFKKTNFNKKDLRFVNEELGIIPEEEITKEFTKDN